jgi:hypothetical protein
LWVRGQAEGQPEIAPGCETVRSVDFKLSFPLITTISSSDVPKYPCPECHRRFTDAAARIRHRKRMHGYVPYHTKEYLARQALNRKERVVQGASKAVSNESSLQQVAHAPNASPSVRPPAPKLPEVAYHDDFWKMPVDITHSYPLQPLPFQGAPLSLPFETLPGYDTPNAIRNFPSMAHSYPSQSLPSQDNITRPCLKGFDTWPGYDTLNAIQNFPSVAHSYPSQPLPSQDFITWPSVKAFETWPVYNGPNAIQNCPSATQSQPTLTHSDFTTDHYSDSHSPQIALHNVEQPQHCTMQSQEQEFGETFTGDHGIPPYNGNGLLNWLLQ